MSRYSVDPELWHKVQVLTYPHRAPSIHSPFRMQGATPKRKPASWLYHLLRRSPILPRQVFP